MLIFLIIIVVLIFIFYTAKIQIEFKKAEIIINSNKIKNLLLSKNQKEKVIEKNESNIKFDEIKTKDEKTKIITDESKIFVYLVLLNKIKIFKRDLTKIQWNKYKNNFKLISKNKKFDITFKKITNKFETKIEKLDLKIQVGTQDASITAYSVAVITIFISFFLRKRIENYNEQRYLVLPIYNDENILKINVDGIFNIGLKKKHKKQKNVNNNSRNINEKERVCINE